MKNTTNYSDSVKSNLIKVFKKALNSKDSSLRYTIIYNIKKEKLEINHEYIGGYTNNPSNIELCSIDSFESHFENVSDYLLENEDYFNSILENIQLKLKTIFKALQM